MKRTWTYTVDHDEVFGTVSLDKFCEETGEYYTYEIDAAVLMEWADEDPDGWHLVA